MSLRVAEGDVAIQATVMVCRVGLRPPRNDEVTTHRNDEVTTLGDDETL